MSMVIETSANRSHEGRIRASEAPGQQHALLLLQQNDDSEKKQPISKSGIPPSMTTSQGSSARDLRTRMRLGKKRRVIEDAQLSLAYINTCRVSHSKLLHEVRR